MKGLLCMTSFSQGNALQWTSNQKWLTQSFFLSRSPYSLCLTAHWKCLLVKSVWILDLLHKRIHQWWVCGYYQCLQTSLKLLSVLIPPPPLLITTPNCSSFTVHSSPLTSHFSLPSLTFHNPPLPLPHSSPLTSHSSLPSLTFHNSPLPLPHSSLLTPAGVLLSVIGRVKFWTTYIFLSTKNYCVMHVQCSLYTDSRKELQDGSDKWTMRGWGWGRRRGDMEVHCAANSWGRWLFEDGVWSRKETIGEFTSVNRLVLNQCKGRNWPHFEVCSVCGWSQADIQWCRHQTTSKTYSWFVSLWRICTVDNCM